MVLPQDSINKGFSLSDVSDSDFNDFSIVGKACYEKYVDEYFGGWADDFQFKMQTDAFNEAKKESCFKKIILKGEIVGFFAFNETDDKIGGISIQMIEKAQNMGLGSFYLNKIVSLSENSKKPIFLKVFKSNPAQNLYKRFGFTIYDETVSHYLMRYDPV